jgi:uncharacterized membrane protein
VSISTEIPRLGSKTARQAISKSEMALLGSSVLVLLTSCILWSPHKQVWMDEILTWNEVSDRSLWHLFSAIQHGADGGQPLFYLTAWLWAKVFGTSVLALRLYSSAAMCAALVVTWRTLRRFYGTWATAFGVLAIWGTSGTLLDQNVEARFYGLYLLAVAVTVHVYTRLIERSAPSRSQLLAAFFSQVALVFTHVLGFTYGALVLLALIVHDAAARRIRVKVYLAWASGWLALFTWIRAIRASMATSKPHGWIVMPTVADLRSAYLFADSLPWLRHFQLHAERLLFQVVRHTAQLAIYLVLVTVLIVSVRAMFQSGWRVVAEGRGPLLLVAFALLAEPIVLFALSHLVTPVLIPRYVLPSVLGLAVVLAAAADKLGADRHLHGRSRFVWAGLVLFFLISPALAVMALDSPATGWDYLDTERLDRSLPPGAIVVAGSQQDFGKIMRTLHHPTATYYFLLDWPTAVQGPRNFVLDYHLMLAYRESGYWTAHILPNRDFLCSRGDFFVLDSPNGSTLDGHNLETAAATGPNWFDLNIRKAPQFEWRVVGSFDGAEVTRRLVAVHRRGSFEFCGR